MNSIYHWYLILTRVFGTKEKCCLRTWKREKRRKGGKRGRGRRRGMEEGKSHNNENILIFNI